jgi:hypothetical protein
MKSNPKLFGALAALFLSISSLSFAAEPKEVELRLPDAKVNTAYSAAVGDQLTAAGIFGAYNLFSSPAFLSWNGGTLVFSGTPASADAGKYVINMLFKENETNPETLVKFTLIVVGDGALACKDGSQASAIGSTPDAKYDLFACMH